MKPKPPLGVPAQPSTPSAASGFERIALPGGRVLDVFLGGDPTGEPLVAHHGTPGDASTLSDWDAACRGQGLRLVCASRPGYAGSTRQAGRAVADAAADTAALLDRLGLQRFLTLGWSGGGPHALACAALLPQRCLAAATLGGVGAWGDPGLDFLAGMGPENVDEFGVALQGEAPLRAWMAKNAAGLQAITGPELAQALGGLVPEADKAVLTGGLAEHLAAAFRRATAPGFDGWIDDDLAFVRPWGFRLEAIGQPVAVWQGELDLMVPLAHGHWLAARLPQASAQIVPGEGHISLTALYRDEVLRGLREAAGT